MKRTYTLFPGLLLGWMTLLSPIGHGQDVSFSNIVNGATAALDIMPMPVLIPPISTEAFVEFVNDDAVPDLVYHWYNYVSHGFANFGRISFLGHPDGRFELFEQKGGGTGPGDAENPNPWPVHYPPPDSSHINLNGDRQPDLVAWEDHRIVILLFHPDGVNPHEQVIPIEDIAIFTVLFADMNQDQFMDMIVVAEKGVSRTLINQFERTSHFGNWQLYE